MTARGDGGRRPGRGGPERGSGRATLRWIFEGAGPDRRLVVAILVVETAQAVLGLALAMWMRQLVNSVTGGDRAGFAAGALRLVLTLIALIGLGAALRFLRDYTSTSVYNRFRLREFGSVLTRDYYRVSLVHSGEWMNRMGSDAGVVADGVTHIVPDVFSMLVRMVGALYLLLLMLPELAAVIIPGGCALAFLTFLFRGKLKGLHKEQQEAQGRVRVFLLDRLQSLLVIHSFSREVEEEREAAGLMEAFRRIRMRRSNFSNVCNVGFGTVMEGAYILGVCYCAWRMLQGTMSYGTLIAVMSLVSQVQSPFANISGYVPRYYAMQASAERLMEVEAWRDAFSKAPHDPSEVAELYEGRMRGLRLEGVGFSYGERDGGDVSAGPGEAGEAGGSGVPGAASAGAARLRPVLRDLSLLIPKGAIVAVTGPSGCGKSTLLKVLMSVYPLDAGRCLIQTDAGSLPLDASWRGLFAYVPQGNQLMAGSIRQTVAFGDERRAQDDEGLWEALRAACAQDFVRALPEGLDTQLGEKGAGLSEGQVQRLAIARALYSGHPVLLLDESTSSLDERTERELLVNLKRLAGRTVVLVTHRRAVLDVCDLEVNMTSQGRLAEVLQMGGDVPSAGGGSPQAGDDLSQEGRGGVRRVQDGNGAVGQVAPQTRGDA